MTIRADHAHSAMASHRAEGEPGAATQIAVAGTIRHLVVLNPVTGTRPCGQPSCPDLSIKIDMKGEAQ
jgi:hypothetical protein